MNIISIRRFLIESRMYVQSLAAVKELSLFVVVVLDSEW